MLLCVLKPKHLHFLWCIPRSRSTAFEKMMVNAGQFTVFGEPFINVYKQAMQSPEAFKLAQAKFDMLFNTLSQHSLKQAVFVKDMAYHAIPFLSNKQILSAQHTFLIRDPRFSIPSLFNMRENFKEEETGFVGLVDLFDRVWQQTGKKPLVFDAESLIKSPKSTVSDYFHHIGHTMPADVLTWKPGSREDWKGRESWHIDAIQSQGFFASKTLVNPEDLPLRVQNIISNNMPHYLSMREHLSKDD